VQLRPRGLVPIRIDNRIPLHRPTLPLRRQDTTLPMKQKKPHNRLRWPQSPGLVPSRSPDTHATPTRNQVIGKAVKDAENGRRATLSRARLTNRTGPAHEQGTSLRHQARRIDSRQGDALPDFPGPAIPLSVATRIPRVATGENTSDTAPTSQQAGRQRPCRQTRQGDRGTSGARTPNTAGKREPAEPWASYQLRIMYIMSYSEHAILTEAGSRPALPV
jgi:hypothetical protein